MIAAAVRGGGAVLMVLVSNDVVNTNLATIYKNIISGNGAGGRGPPPRGSEIYILTS